MKPPLTECDEVADNFPLPPRRLTFDEALAIVRAQMPDESETILSNIAERLRDRSRHACTAGSPRATNQKRTIGSTTAADQITTNAMTVTVWKAVGMAPAAASAREPKKQTPAAVIATTAMTCLRLGRGMRDAR